MTSKKMVTLGFVALLAAGYYFLPEAMQPEWIERLEDLCPAILH